MNNYDKKSIEVFNTICSALDEGNHQYTKDEKTLSVEVNIIKDLKTVLIMFDVNSRKKEVNVISPLPIAVKEGKEIDTAMMTAINNNNLSFGKIVYAVRNNLIYLNFTVPYDDSEPMEEEFEFVIDYALRMQYFFNPDYAALNLGKLTIEEFINRGIKDDDE